MPTLVSDRLRRLDALFAERVLGLTVIYDIPDPDLGEVDSDDRWTEFLPGASRTGGDTPLPRYTRSLDAAWEGVDRLINGDELWEVEFSRLETARTWKCYLRSPKHDYVSVLTNTTSEDWFHPAEALVLACLRAVGVPESDLE